MSVRSRDGSAGKMVLSKPTTRDASRMKKKCSEKLRVCCYDASRVSCDERVRH